MSAGEKDLLTPSSRVVSAPDRRRLLLYLLPFVLLPFLVMAAALVIVPTPWFRVHSGSSYLASMGYGAKLHDTVCDIAVYGDSSALLAVDPAILKEKTGLSACNLAEFEGVTLMNGTELVDIFLRNNPRPRFLVFLYTPDYLLLPSTWRPITMFEAISYNLEYERTPRTLLLLLRHIDETFAWAEYGVRRAIQRVHTPAMAAEIVHQREAERGLYHYPPDTATGCTASSHPVAPDTAWVASLRSRYGVDGTRVLVDATPTAPCDPDLAFFREHLQGVVDNLPYSTIPVTDFMAEGHLHVNGEGSQLISRMLADQINVLRGNAMPPHQTAALAGGR